MDCEIVVSIIIPVYNGEKYIKTCVESVRRQTYTNIEIILVNDGSTDNSLRICQEYCDLDERILIVNQENSGVSTARNNGIKKASGDKIVFVDADDWVEDNYVQSMLEYNSDGSFLICGFSKVEKDKSKYSYYKRNKQIDVPKAYRTICRNQFIWNIPWNKLYDRNVIMKNDIRFDPSVKVGEDLLFNFEYIMLADIKSVFYIAEPLYNYRIHLNSAMGNLRQDDFSMQEYVLMKKMLALSKKYKFPRDLENTLKIFCYYRSYQILDKNTLPSEILDEVKVFFEKNFKLLFRRNMGKRIKIDILKYIFMSKVR